MSSTVLDELANLVQQLDQALPQTQCTRCGYPDCRSYAEAIASGEAEINQCPPGGEEGVRRLAALTGKPVQALNPENGIEATRALAVIDENWCIGCTLCIKACPVDCHSRRPQADACNRQRPMHRLRALHSGLSSRLHFHGRRQRRSLGLGGLEHQAG